MGRDEVGFDAMGWTDRGQPESESSVRHYWLVQPCRNCLLPIHFYRRGPIIAKKVQPYVSPKWILEASFLQSTTFEVEVQQPQCHDVKMG